jgi:mannose-6-phosphate isomerase-like protein (cupin superfamily)
LPGLGEHGSEGDDIARSHVLADRAVGTTAFDDPLHGVVDLVAHRQGFRGCDRRPAMQRQDEFVPLGNRGFNEGPQRVAGCRAVTFGRLHGPPPDRHDFEEMFTVLDGEVQVTFRGETLVARAGETINVPANAPHAFTNAGDKPSRLLCMCAPSGQEEFFTLVGQPVATRTEAPPPLDADAQAAFIAKSKALAPEYKTELLPPPARNKGQAPR